MRLRAAGIALAIVCLAQTLSGCGAMIQSAMVGAGKSATADDTGFLSQYQNLAAVQDPAFPSLPDLSYISPHARVGNYNKVLMPDFSAITPDIEKLKGLQIRQYKGIKQELPDLIANTFDGTAFKKVSRSADLVDAKNLPALKKLGVDAVLFGNIKELVSLGGEHSAGLTAIQIEYKLVDARTGEEVVTAIHRGTTDLDKVAMGQVRVLLSLLNKAKAQKSAPGDASANASGASASAAAATGAAAAGADAAKAGLPNAAGSAAKAETLVILKKFHGIWENKSRGCKNWQGSETHMVVDAKSIKMFEMSCALNAVSNSSGATFAGDFTCNDPSGDVSVKFNLKSLSANEIQSGKDKMIHCK